MTVGETKNNKLRKTLMIFIMTILFIVGVILFQQKGHGIFPTEFMETIEASPTMKKAARFTAVAELTPTISLVTQSTPSLPTFDSYLWYLQAGKIYRFNFQTWQTEELSIDSQGPIQHAELSTDTNILVFYDSEGLKYINTQPVSNPVLISSDQSIRSRDYLISDDGNHLAYSDEKVLYMIDFSSGNSRILIKHTSFDINSENYDTADVRVYSPIQWSPQNDWLIVEEGYYEGSSYKYLSSNSGKLLPSSACFPQFSSSGDSNSLVFSAMFGGYGHNPCGQEGGIYLVEFSEVATETQLYEDQDNGLDISSQIVHMSSSFDGSSIAFVEYILVNNYSKRTWKFILSIFSITEGEIYSQESAENVAYLYPAWSDDGKHLYYSETDEAQTTIYSLSLDSLLNSKIARFKGEVCSFSFIPNSDWFLISIRQSEASDCALGLMDIQSGKIFPVEFPNNATILGWETEK